MIDAVNSGFTIGQLQEAFPELNIEPDPLGEGRIKIAFGATWKGKPVVLKFVKAALIADSDGSVQIPEQTKREIRALRRMDSPRIAQVVRKPRKVVIGGKTYLSFLERRYSDDTLKTRMSSSLSEEQTVSLVGDLLEAIDVLSDQDLVHRDIKPSNIVFDEQQRAVLLDFDVALHLDLDPLTSDSALGPGTERYAAPEQWIQRGRTTLDFRADLFSVGVVAFEALTGVHPFGYPERGWHERLTQGEVAAGHLDRCCGVSFRDLLLRLLAPEPNQRYRNITLANRDLEMCQ